MEQKLEAQPKPEELRNGENPGEVVAASLLIASVLREQRLSEGEGFKRQKDALSTASPQLAGGEN